MSNMGITVLCILLVVALAAFLYWNYFKRSNDSAPKEEELPDDKETLLQKIRERFPNLSDVEVDTVYMCYMGYSTSDIARHFNVQPDSLRKRMYRIRQKTDGADLRKIYCRPENDGGEKNRLYRLWHNKHLVAATAGGVVLLCIGMLLAQYSSDEEDWAVACRRYPEISRYDSVLEHYKDDTLKLKAAKFLLAHMGEHRVRQGMRVDSFYAEVDSLFRVRPRKSDGWYFKAYDSLLVRFHRSRLPERLLCDLDTVSPGYLIAHIDSLFAMRAMPWAPNCSFEHFCKYVLPYRVGDEPVSTWLPDYAARYRPQFDKFRGSQRNYHYIYGILPNLNRSFHNATYLASDEMPSFPLNQLMRIYIGNCNSYTDRNVAQLRALGLPAAKDFTPQWGSHGMGHSWAVFLPDDGQVHPFGQNEFIGHHFFVRPYHRLPKVYRYMFDRQKEMEEIVWSGEERPELFESPCIMDVTDKYVATSDIAVELFPFPHGLHNRRWVYLSVFNNTDWTVVQFAERHDDKATFKKMGRGVVYLPTAYREHGQLCAIGYPRALYDDGRVRTLKPDTLHRHRVRLVRKYGYTNWHKELCRRTWGGQFQVATKPDFSDALTVGVIDSITECRFYSVPLQYEGNYRYFRYLSPQGSYGNMAEVIVTDSLGHTPEIKTMLGIRGATRGCNLEKMFDGDVLTYYNLPFPNGGWAGMEFDKPVHLKEVRFVPRNDDNFIREGEQYQLFYWNYNDWELIAECTGNREGVLYVDNVPDNALLLLHNRTRGREERIFTYEDGEQRWW